MSLYKKCFISALAYATLLVTSPLQAEEGLFEGPHEEEYSYELTDANQRHVAVGMTIWGIAITVITVIVVAIVPNSSSPTAATGEATTGTSGGGLF